MKPTTKKLLVTICLGAGLLATACSETSNSLDTAGKGQILIGMTTGTGPTITATGSAGLSTTGTRAGAPSPATNMSEPSLSSLKSAIVTFSKIQVRRTDGTWVDIPLQMPQKVDMLTIRDGKSAQLPPGLLAAGTYDRLMVTITQIDIVLVDYTQISITPPAGGWTVEIPTTPFEIVENQSTAVLLKFREDVSFQFLGGEIQFEPVFECQH